MSLARRLSLAFQNRPTGPRGPSKKLLMGELDILAEPLRRVRRTIPVKRSNKPRIVMFLPGFLAHPLTMRFLAKQVERAGHTVYRWGQGANLGPTEQHFANAERRLAELYARHGEEKLVLVGWSLGGLFARELALRHPDKVAKVITMGSPFSGSRRANNAWRLYHLVTGHSVDDPPVEIGRAHV